MTLKKKIIDQMVERIRKKFGDEYIRNYQDGKLSSEERVRYTNFLHDYHYRMKYREKIEWIIAFPSVFLLPSAYFDTYMSAQVDEAFESAIFSICYDGLDLIHQIKV